MDAKQTRQGVLLALAAYFIWGIAPAYFKLIYYVPADEILTHRADESPNDFGKNH
ncbi:hypothetical protein I0D01_22135 [Escherichia coli]|nr:hypothetical protein [Escherichia coli]